MLRENVEIERDELENQERNVEDLGPGLEPDTLLLDSQDALQIMYEQLGNEFYQDCRFVDLPLIMTLEYGFPNVSDVEV